MVALTYRATVDVPPRFRKSTAVGAVFGLDVLQVSIRRDRSERENITLRRRDDAGFMLYEAAQSMLRSKKWVLAQGLGDADRQAPRGKKSDRGPNAGWQ